MKITHATHIHTHPQREIENEKKSSVRERV